MDASAPIYPAARISSGISIQPLLAALLFIALFTGFQGGRYYAGNIAQELGLLCSGLLFLIGGFTSLFHIPRQEWNRWVLWPLFLMGSIVCLWGIVFAVRFGGNPLYNMMASREFFFILLAPGIYLCGRSGMSLNLIEKVIWAVILASICNYLFNYFRLDLKEAFFSADHRISSLITYDEWRGFRLKPPLFAVMIGLLASLAILFSRAKASFKIFALIVAGLSIYTWSIVMFRSTLATMLLSVLLYPLILSRSNRMHLLVVVLPIVALASPIGYEFVLSYFQNADGGQVRLASYALAFEEIPKRWILGTGEDSAFGVTYSALFGAKFFPSDLGLVGITFKYGFLGLALYLFFHFKILFLLSKTHWFCVEEKLKANALVWALMIFFCAQTFNLVLNPGLAYAQGITVASMAMALCGLIRQKH